MAQIYWPFDQSLITEGFGWADWRQGIHDGIDFGVAQGTELRATASGIVRNNDAGPRDGAGVDITTDDGWKVRHWHVSKFLVPNGSYVNAGDVIALSGGAKGTWGAGFSTGAHLHWGVRTGANWVDPRSLNPLTFDQIGKEEDDMAQPMYFCAVSASPSGIVAKNDMFVRNAPGEPLLRLTAGQWSDWYWRDLPDKYVVYKDGNWFDEAFKEDNYVHEVNVKAHPWMAESSSGSGSTASQIATAVEAQLKDEFAAIPKSVNDDVAKRMGN